MLVAVTPGARRGILAVALASLLLIPAGRGHAATDTGTGTITIAHQVVPSTDAGRVDLALDGAVLGRGIAGGGAIGPLTVASGSHTVSTEATAGTAATYTTTVTCTDGSTSLVDSTETASVSVVVGEAAAVVCTFTRTAAEAPPSAPAITAPPVPIGVPVLLPPVMVRGRATLRGPEGCTSASVVRSRMVAVNALVVRFYRDGRLVRTIRNDDLGRLVATLRTRLAPNDLRLHTVTIRVRFITGAQPARINLVHRFGRCRQGSVTG